MTSGSEIFGPAVVGTINYAKRGTKSKKQEDGTVESMNQGGQFMENKQKADPSGKALLDMQQLHVFDARPAKEKLNLDIHGVQIVNLKTELPETLEVLFHAQETDIRKTYWPEVEALVRRSVTTDGRSPKYVFVIGTQKFSEDKSRGLLGSYSRSAHTDFTEVVFDGAFKMFTKRGVPEAEAKELDIMFVNAWRPFGRTVADNPLTILDWTSVDPERDVHILKRGTKTMKGSIYGAMLTHNPNHRWLYIPNMTPEEMWLFKQADSRVVNKKAPSHPNLAQYAFHTSFRLPTDLGDDRTRRSIALRLVLGFEKTGPKANL